MKRRTRTIVITLVVLIAVISFFAVRRMAQLGAFTSLTSVSPGVCRTVAAPAGPEDLELDEALGVIFVSADDRRAAAKGDVKDGGIYLTSASTPGASFTLLTGAGSGTPTPFHPLGLSIAVAPDGARTLMAINHRGNAGKAEAPNVELFDVVDGRPQGGAITLRHRRTITSPLFTWPNDLAAAGPDKFYVSNSFGSTSSLGMAMEFLFGLARANVLWFDGQTARVAAADLTFANGVALSADGATLYAAETAGQRLSAFKVNPQDGALELAIRQDFGTGLDNITIDRAGILWIAAHPRLLDIASHASNPASFAPSQILSVEPQAGGAARTVYLGDGAEVSAASTAVHTGGKLVAGVIHDPKLLICDLPQ